MSRREYRRTGRSVEEIDAIIERLRDFLRSDYMSEKAAAKKIGVGENTLSAWLKGRARPSKPDRVTAFLNGSPQDEGSGIAPTGYQYREYKNWWRIPKPRRCPFCKRAKGEIRKARGGVVQGVCPNCGASGPKWASYDEALRAWNGRRAG